MKIIMEKVFERDIDLLMINKFCNDQNVLNYFCSKLGINNYYVESIQHSVSDENGESDISVILNNAKEKIAFLIENKIDAIAMPNQRARYDIRGNNGITNKLYDKYYVFIIAPKAYLSTNNEAKKYENQISYEELQELFNDDNYSISLLAQAIEEKKKGYVVIENENVTEFWKHYYDYVEKNYPKLNINKVTGPRGSSASWPTFNTPIQKYKIRHKSDRGYVDLEFPKIADKYFDFYEIVKEYLSDDMTVHITGKSISVRLIVPKIDFKQDFLNYGNEMKISIDSVARLQALLFKLDHGRIDKLYE